MDFFNVVRKHFIQIEALCSAMVHHHEIIFVWNPLCWIVQFLCVCGIQGWEREEGVVVAGEEGWEEGYINLRFRKNESLGLMTKIQDWNLAIMSWKVFMQFMSNPIFGWNIIQRNHSLLERKPRYIGTVTKKQHFYKASSSSLLQKGI